MPNFNYITDFYKSRKDRIGASEVAALVPNPHRPGESFAGYGRTAVTVYEEKVGLREREQAGLAADIGNFYEPRILMEFIRDFYGCAYSIDINFYKAYQYCEIERLAGNRIVDCSQFNGSNPFKHHTEAVEDYAVAHPDMLYIPSNKEGKIKNHNITFDLSKPAIIEAKSAQYWATKRKGDPYSGYDFDATGWQGIPMKHYLQILFQMTLCDIHNAYLALFSNTSQKAYWHIKPNKKWQSKLQQLAWDMRQAIKKRQPPKHLAISSSDINALYPEIKEDFEVIAGDDLDKALEIAKGYDEAQGQRKEWERKEKEYRSAMSIFLKDSGRIDGIIDGRLQEIANWKSTGGGERLMGLKEIKELDKKYYRYLKKNGLIKKAKSSRMPDIKLKFEEVV
jgi:hypothetical protein